MKINSDFFFIPTMSRGSAIAKIVGANAARLPNFDDRVTMYVFEELIEGKKLTEIINETHENVKYLPGHKLPANVVSVEWAIRIYIYQFPYSLSDTSKCAPSVCV